MTLKEIYKLPDGSNVTLNCIPSFFDGVEDNFPCPISMANAFAQYKGCSLPVLDSSNVVDITAMCEYCTNLVSFNAENWDVSKVTDMSKVFNHCTKLTSLDLSSWNSSNVVTMNNTFSQCIKLVTLSSIKADSLNIKSYEYPFGTTNNTTLVDWGGFINLKSSWNGTYAVEKLTALSHQSLINILNGLYDFTGNGQVPTSAQGKLKLGTTHLAKLTDDEKAIATNKGWVLS